MLTRIAIVLAAVCWGWAQSNAELAKIFADDQAAREHQFTMSAAQVAEMVKADGPRRKRVRDLLDAGSLHTAEDYVRAAFLFQHGGEPNDYLLAHVLGLIATKMDGSGAWISAATLDRYLLTTGKPQIFGLGLDDKQPFDKGLITDGMRQAVCAPSVASRGRLMASLAKDPANPVMEDPCMFDLKALRGKWVLSTKGTQGEFTSLTMDFTVDKDGGFDVKFSGPAVPEKAKTELGLSNDRLRVQVGSGVYELVVRGDVMTGRYTSGEFSAAAVGVR
jgi:hypothetical protein